MRYQLQSIDGKKIASTLIAGDAAWIPQIINESQLIANGKMRVGSFQNTDGRLFAFSNNPDYLKSSQSFKRTARCILESTNYINEIAAEQREINNRNTTRLIHNLTSLNAHNIQEIYSLIPQEEISGRTRGHIDFVKEKILAYPKEAAQVFLRLAKTMRQ